MYDYMGLLLILLIDAVAVDALGTTVCPRGGGLLCRASIIHDCDRGWEVEVGGYCMNETGNPKQESGMSTSTSHALTPGLGICFAV